MKRILLSVFVGTAIFIIFCTSGRTVWAAEASFAGSVVDFASVLPKNHPEAEVKEKGISACITCHKPDISGKAVKNSFSAKIHMAALASKANRDCLVCHIWVPGQSFGIIGGKGSLGAPTGVNLDLMKKEFSSWASSDYLDNLHAKADVVCAGCHGKDLPKAGNTVENARCLVCHGPMDQLVRKTKPKNLKDLNPHESHLENIACTACHKGHTESKAYCLQCHTNFDMKIKGTSKTKQ
jgi:hypothetical protein